MSSASSPPPSLAGPGSSSRADESRSARRRVQDGWAILYRVPSFLGADDLIRGFDFAARLRTPPNASKLLISRGLFPDPDNVHTYGFIHCVDSTGRFLLVSASQGDGTERLLVCEAGSGKAFALPPVPSYLNLPLSTKDCVGIVNVPRGGSDGGWSYIVSHLHLAPAPSPSTVPESTSAATAPEPAPSATAPESETAPAPRLLRLLSYHSYDKKWRSKVTTTPPCDAINNFEVDTVVSHDDLLAFVDLKCGMVLCDPLIDGQNTRLVLFPIPYTCTQGENDISGARWTTGSRRCLTVSRDKLYFVSIHSSGGTDVLKMWSLCDTHAEEWVLENKISLSDIWADATFKAAGFPAEVPSIGLVDPKDPGIVYLMSGCSLFAVELATGRTVEFDISFNDGGLGHSSTEFCGWLPPPPFRSSLSAGQIAWGAVKEYANSTGAFLQSKKKYIDMLPNAADVGAFVVSAVVPSSVGAADVWPAAKLMTKVATTAVKAINLGDTLSQLRKPDRGDHQIVGTVEEAKMKISIWNEAGRPHGVWFGFPHDMADEDKVTLRELFEDLGVEKNLVWDTEERFRDDEFDFV